MELKVCLLVLFILLTLTFASEFKSQNQQRKGGRTGLLNDNERYSRVASRLRLSNYSNVHNPVLLVPGDGASRLEARLNKTSRVHHWCYQVSDWFDIWLNIHLLTPATFDCLSDNLRLYYDPISRTSNNAPGIEIQAKDFGLLSSVDYLDHYHIPMTDYFHKIASTLVAKNDLKPDKSLVAAPYDFRKAPNELGTYFESLTNLVEQTFVRNDYRPVTLICHSMGCLNTVHLLNQKSQRWKDTFVRRLVSLAAPWAGSFKAISTMLLGDNLGVPLLNNQKLQALQSTFPSLMYLFPRAPAFSSDQVLIESAQVNFTLDNLDQFFDQMNMTDQREMWYDTRNIGAQLEAPNVELWCLYGLGLPTPAKIVYLDASGPPGRRFFQLHSDGDGTVNSNSLRACETFALQQDKPVYTRTFNGTSHIAILRGNEAANLIADEILANDLEDLPRSPSHLVGWFMQGLEDASFQEHENEIYKLLRR